MRIQGIIASDGDAAHISEMSVRLKEAFVEMRKYTRANSEPQIDWAATELHTMTDKAKLAVQMAAADGTLFVAYAGALHTLEDLTDTLRSSSRSSGGELRGKWTGLILLGAAPLIGHHEGAAGRVLARANMAGMMLVPSAVALLLGKRPKEHLRLARDMAKAVISQDEWKGSKIWDEAA